VGDLVERMGLFFLNVIYEVHEQLPESSRESQIVTSIWKCTEILLQFGKTGERKSCGLSDNPD
jgi:hypothetical protein